MASPYHLAGRDQPLGTHLAESAEPIPRSGRPEVTAGWFSAVAPSPGWRRERGLMRSGEADIQREVPEPEVEGPASGQVPDGRKQEDGHNETAHPEADHDDAANPEPASR